MKSIAILSFLFCCFQLSAQQWDSWLDDYSWSYEKIYPGKYNYEDVIKFEKEVDMERLNKALEAESPKKVLVLKYFESIPKEIFELKTIEVLDISWGNFYLNELRDIDQFQQLKAINLFHTAKNKEVDGYTVYENGDALPENFGNLKNLEYLRLYNNGIEEPIPDEFGDLTNLKQLQIASQPALILPESIGNLKNLKVVSFYHMNENGRHDLPAAFFDLKQLVSLELGMIWTEEADLAKYHWSNLTALQELQIDTYSGVYRKQIPEAVFQLSGLKRLYYPSGVPLSKEDRQSYKSANKKLKIIKIK
ncbi:MAG: hypothetical protein R8G66_07375 [Cytophagales bacterium]|nr:hypothetical protein [Cytophagales bacterium]